MVGRCSLCEQAQPRKKYLCVACFLHSAASRRHDIATLSKDRDVQLERLQEALVHKEEQQRREVQLLQLNEGLRESRQRVAELEQRLQAIRRRAAELRQYNLERQARLREAGEQLGRWVQQAQRECSGQLEALGQNYLRSLDTLTREQRNRVVRRLLDILPVKLMPPGSPQGRGAPRGAPQPIEGERALVMICGQLLPDSRDDIGELVQLLPQLGSSLGYVALLLDVLSRFLQLPLLHRASFQGSTTRIWQPASFWDMGTAVPPGALPLFSPKHPDGGHHHGSSLYSAVAGMAGGAGAAGGEERAQARLQQDLQRALYCLQRSAGAVVYARLGPDAALKVPPDWAPFAWLGGLCKMLGAEPRPTLSASRVMAVPVGVGGAAHAQYHHARLAGGSGLAASAVFGRLSPERDGMAQSMIWPDEDGADEEWDIIPRPSYGRMIPPPPSQPDDVEHWTQAMYPGTVPSQQQQQQPSPVSSSPVERLRALTRTYLGGGGST